MRVLWLLFVPIFVMGSAHAALSTDIEIRDDFRTSSVAIPLALERLGYSQFGDLNLAEIVKLAQTQMAEDEAIQVGDWFYRKDRLDVLRETARSTVKWTRDANQKVQWTINRILYAIAPRAVREVIGFHEVLVPAGFADQQYVISASLWMLTLIDFQKALLPVEQDRIKDAIQLVAKGGITVVGGGGDSYGVNTKLEMIRLDLAVLRKKPIDRAKAWAMLIDDFQIVDEVHWSNARGHSLEFQSVPSEKYEEIERVKQCDGIVAMARNSQIQFHQALLRTHPEIKVKLPTVQSLVNFCQRVLNGDSP